MWTLNSVHVRSAKNGRVRTDVFVWGFTGVSDVEQEIFAVLRTVKQVSADLRILSSAENGCGVRTLIIEVHISVYGVWPCIVLPSNRVTPVRIVIGGSVPRQIFRAFS